MGWLAGCLQALGAVGLAVGLFLVLSPGLALAVVSCLAVAGGTALEVGRRPRVVPAPETVAQARAHSLDDYRRTASER
jgi:hypothetical protein